MSNLKLVRQVDPSTLPPELTDNLRTITLRSKDYNIHQLVLAFIGHYGRATGDDLMIYVYQVRRKILSRGYLHQVIHRLRRDGLIAGTEGNAPNNIFYTLTEKGEDAAPAYVEPSE